MKRVKCIVTALGVAGLIWTIWTSGVEGQAPAPKQPVQPGPAPGARAMDQPVAWMQEAKRNYSAVKDYTCTLISRERVKGTLKEENIIQMKFRVTPFSLYMRWLGPAESKNQEVAYMHGKNNNQMRVQSKGILKLAGFVSVDVNDPRVLEHSRHTIYEAGIGNMIDHALQLWQVEQKVNRTDVKIAEYDYNSRRCIRVECTRPERRPEFYAYRTVMYLDKDSKLPIRHESYDWPRAGGLPTGELLESYSYADLRFNVGLTDKDFAR